MFTSARWLVKSIQGVVKRWLTMRSWMFALLLRGDKRPPKREAFSPVRHWKTYREQDSNLHVLGAPDPKSFPDDPRAVRACIHWFWQVFWQGESVCLRRLRRQKTVSSNQNSNRIELEAWLPYFAYPTGGGSTFWVRLGIYVSPCVKIFRAGDSGLFADQLDRSPAPSGTPSFLAVFRFTAITNSVRKSAEHSF